MPDYTTPGVYINENSGFPPSIAEVETAIPVFIGYTEKATENSPQDLINLPKKINSLQEYIQFFGHTLAEQNIEIHIETSTDSTQIIHTIGDSPSYLMYYSVQFYFANGGGPCYIVSIGETEKNLSLELHAHLTGLEAAGRVDEITLNVFPDATNLENPVDYYALITASLNQCQQLKDRFTICDVYMHHQSTVNDIDVLRTHLNASTELLSYGAAYYPYLETGIQYHYNTKDIKVFRNGNSVTLNTLEVDHDALYAEIKAHISSISMQLPSSPAMAGIYARVDRNYGVWKAPANVEVEAAKQPTVIITNEDQESLNIDATGGKSINAIRNFTGRGVTVWGARTLAGNNNQWRYIPVRRFYNMVNESTSKALSPFVFEPNDANTWNNIEAMISNFLMLQWKAGALAGAKPEQAFYVQVGLGKTMTANDIYNGIMNIEIGMAIIKPAEFILSQLIIRTQQSH